MTDPKVVWLPGKTQDTFLDAVVKKKLILHLGWYTFSESGDRYLPEGSKWKCTFYCCHWDVSVVR